MVLFLRGVAASIVGYVLRQPEVHFYTLPPDEPDRGILFVILETFVLVGAMVVGCLVLGSLVGGFRVWLLRRFPNNPWNGSGRDVPRLDLR